jgi:transposase
MNGILGIDLAKQSFESQVIKANGQRSQGHFENNLSGYEQLQQWLVKEEVTEVHACMEATNIYWEALAEYLVEQGHQVSVVNPAQIKGFAQSQLQRTKTDKQDSQVIADFCAQTKPARWQPPTAAQRQLRAWVRHRDGLVKTRTQQLNRLDSCADELVRSSLQRLIATLEQQIAAMESQIEGLIAQTPDLQVAYGLLLSIKGLGPATVIKLLAEFYDLATYASACSAVADAGLTPAHHESGTSVYKRPRMSKIGKRAVRGALYWPAITAIRYNPLVKELADRLRARGKANKVIIGAAIRKLLHLAYGVLKNQTPFDPAYAH